MRGAEVLSYGGIAGGRNIMPENVKQQAFWNHLVFGLFRWFSEIRGSLLLAWKDNPRIARNTRNNTKRVEFDLESRRKKPLEWN